MLIGLRWDKFVTQSLSDIIRIEVILRHFDMFVSDILRHFDMFVSVILRHFNMFVSVILRHFDMFVSASDLTRRLL